MSLTYKRATIEDIDILTETRIEVLRAANKLSYDIDMSEVKKQSYGYYKKALCNDTHIAYLIFNENCFVGTGGVSFFQVMPTYHNPSDTKSKGIPSISLETTAMGRPLYEKYGFAAEGIRKNYYQNPAEDALMMRKIF